MTAAPPDFAPPPSAPADPRGVAEHPIVFFDGVCGLCNRAVEFIIRHDAAGVFRFAPLQGQTACGALPPEWTRSLGTLVLWDGRGRHRRSAAVVRILWRLPGAWRWLGTLLWLVPLPVRNLGYRLIAATRYRWFGKKESCRLPSPDERGRFLP